MTSKIKYFKIVMLLIILTSIINSCRKDQPNCSGNCVNISINGNAYLKTNGSALTNIPVEVNWFKNAYCIGCTSYKVASGKTSNDGKFNFNTTIDSTFFRDYFLSVRVPTDTNYITVPTSGGVNFNEERFYDFNLNALQNIKFEFYPKAFLTINLHRTLSDNFNYFTVDHNFTTAFGYDDFLIIGPQFATDTTIKVETSANIYTRIVWKKTVIGGQSNEQTDSLICTNNGTNIFNINY
jgi:hypothetical protein